MSGGSLNYLCYAEPGDLFGRVDELEAVEQVLLGQGAEDVARDVRQLIACLRITQVSITRQATRLHSILHAVEWNLSGDIGDEALKKKIEEYRKGERNT